MAHFAELDENNKVLRVIVVANKDTADVNGVEKEYIGAGFCEKLFGGTWKQTSYNGNFRKNYAGTNYTYNEELDAFIPPKDEGIASWVLNEETCLWEPPVPYPGDPENEDEMCIWDEETVSWIVVPREPIQ